MLSSYYDDAKEALETSINENSMLSFTSFNSPLASQGIIEALAVEHFGSDDSDRANMQVYLQFREYEATDEGKFEQVLHPMTLIMLNSEGDTKWTPRMRSNVWGNRYPDTVAVDKDTGEVYLVFVETWGVELRHFARMPLDALSAFMVTLNEQYPFHIFIDSEAMFRVLDGSEGYNYLLNNTYIHFESANSFDLKIYSREDD